MSVPDDNDTVLCLSCHAIEKESDEYDSINGDWPQCQLPYRIALAAEPPWNCTAQLLVEQRYDDDNATVDVSICTYLVPSSPPDLSQLLANNGSYGNS